MSADAGFYEGKLVTLGDGDDEGEEPATREVR